MSSVYCPLPVMKRKSSLRRTAAPIPVTLMAVSSLKIRFRLFRSLSHSAFHRARAGVDSLDDVVIAGAAAKIAVEFVPDGFLVEVVALAVHHVDRGHDHAGRAIAALQSVVLTERRLHRVQFVASGEPFDGRHLRAFHLPGESGAGLAR